MEKEIIASDAFVVDAELTSTDPIALFKDREDKGSQPGPEDSPSDVNEIAGPAAADLEIVRWPSSDAEAPDFAYLSEIQAPRKFELSADVLDAMVRAARYSPYRDKGILAFALRGARLVDGHEAERQDKVAVEVTRPDHRSFQCLLGFWHLDTGTISAYTGSTVPCRRAIFSARRGGDPSNMLPTGQYIFYVWRHKNIWPALRMSTGNGTDNALESTQQVTVLRSRNDDRIDTTDIFDLSVPADNVHCAYYTDEQVYEGASFSSWGCLTVRGTRNPSHQWARYQSVLSDLGYRHRIDLMLGTGKEASLASQPGGSAHLVALRPGSTGDEVKRLQEALGMVQSGTFGPVTADKFTSLQRAFNDRQGRGRIADGILTPALAAEMGLNVFQLV